MRVTAVTVLCTGNLSSAETLCTLQKRTIRLRDWDTRQGRPDVQNASVFAWDYGLFDPFNAAAGLLAAAVTKR